MITVAIVTKNRPLQLKFCLQTLQLQTRKPSKVVVIDNTHYSKRSVAESRNLAIEQCQTDFLAFIDDDCVANPDWLDQGLKAIGKHTYVYGKSDITNKHNLIALAEYTHHRYWLKRSQQPFKFDTKNVILNLKKIPKNLRFDSSFTLQGIDSSDTDFGLTLEKHHLTGMYAPQMIVSHTEPDRLIAHLRKQYTKGILAAAISHKWQLTHEFIDPANGHLMSWLKSFRHFRTTLNQYTQMLPKPLWQKIIITLYIKLFEFSFTRGFLSKSDSSV